MLMHVDQPGHDKAPLQIDYLVPICSLNSRPDSGDTTVYSYLDFMRTGRGLTREKDTPGGQYNGAF
jgi:hypothetical protein